MPTLTIPYIFSATMTLPGAMAPQAFSLRGNWELPHARLSPKELVVSYRVYGRNGKARITEIRQWDDRYWCRVTQGFEGEYIRALADYQRLVNEHVDMTDFGRAALRRGNGLTAADLIVLPNREQFIVEHGLEALPGDYHDDAAQVEQELSDAPVVVLEGDKRMTVWSVACEPWYAVSTVQGLPVVVNAFWKDKPHPAFQSKGRFNFEQMDAALAEATVKAAALGSTDDTDVQLLRFIEAADGAVENPIIDVPEPVFVDYADIESMVA